MLIDLLWHIFGANALPITDIIFDFFDAIQALMTPDASNLFGQIIEFLFT